MHFRKSSGKSIADKPLFNNFLFLSIFLSRCSVNRFTRKPNIGMKTKANIELLSNLSNSIANYIAPGDTCLLSGFVLQRNVR